MKKIAVLLLVVAFSACEKDDTTPSDTDPRDAFVAAWNCNENSQQNGTSTFEVHINKSTTDASQLIIENLYNYGFSFKPYAELNSTGTEFTIPSQIIQGNSVEGNGSLLGTTTLNMSYTVDNGSGIDTITSVLTKK